MMRPFTTAAQMRTIPRSTRFANGGVSFWFRDIGLPERGPALDGDADYDVCVVGAGYTGLWAVYYLKKERPDLRIAVIEREFAGFGASGRNGGWLSAEFPGSRESYARSHGKAAMIALQRTMMRTVDEVVSVAEKEGIDADIVKGGMRLVAVNAAQQERLQSDVDRLQTWGYWPDDLHMLGAEPEPRIAVRGAVACAYSPHAARVHPAKLATGLARVVTDLGVDLFEGTAVQEIRSGTGTTRPEVVTGHGTVRADHVLRATEGFTTGLRGPRCAWMPMSSSMIVTEPLSDEQWEQIGWRGQEVLGDVAHSSVHAQRTADGRIAIGGRGTPQRSGTGLSEAGATQPRTIAGLWQSLTMMFPGVVDVPVEHAWSGPLGVTRDGGPTVLLDRETGLGWAGGYAGSGVASANLAGRTLRDLVLGRVTALTRLPWVGHEARVPPRRLGTQFVRGLYRTADRRESKTSAGKGRTSRLAGLATRLSGR